MSMDELSKEEQAFAAENYGLLIRFMQSYHLNDDYYGALAARYLSVVKRYLNQSELQKYSFSTILWMSLRSELSHFFRAEQRMPQLQEFNDRTLGTIDLPEETEEHIDLKMLGCKLTKRQRDILNLWSEGLSHREIAEKCEISYKAVEGRWARIRKKLRENKE